MAIFSRLYFVGGQMAGNQIEVKRDLEHIQLRPEMYIGSVYSPDHLLQEVLDNAFDEIVNGFADTVTIDFIDESHVVITDNGRGIPVHPVKLETGEMKDSIIVACTKLFSGAKFDNNTYNFSIGLHGVGLCAVNALSEYVRVSVKDRKNPALIHDYMFQNSEFTEQATHEYDVEWSTRIEFHADSKYFTLRDFNRDKFATRLRLVKAKYPNAKLCIDGVEIQEITMDSFVRENLDIPTDIPLMKVSHSSNKIQLEAFITYDPTSSAAIMSKGDVNLHMCGGTYLTNVTTLFMNTMLETLNLNVTKSELQAHFRCYVSLFVHEASFDSQAKHNMTKNISSLILPMKDNIKQICKHPHVKRTVEAILEKKSFQRAAKKIAKKKPRVSPENPLVDCLQTPGDILYIMEGKSADGTLGSIRDSNTEAIMPISGKILNVVGSSVEKAVDSKKFKYILESLGVQLNKKQQKFRYNKVKILCDADPDGMHIAVLAIMGIWYFAPQLINEGRVSVILPPLYGAKRGQHFIPLYDLNDVTKYRNQGYEIIRYKGIGEMSPDQLEVVIRKNCIEYIITSPGDSVESVVRCLSDTDVKRKLCADKDHFNLNKLFETSTP